MSRLIFVGDSADAQITARYVPIQTNNAYSQKVGIEQAIPKSAIKGYISYCGPLDLAQVSGESGGDAFSSFFMDIVGWSLTGTKKWR